MIALHLIDLINGLHSAALTPSMFLYQICTFLKKILSEFFALFT